MTKVYLGETFCLEKVLCQEIVRNNIDNYSAQRVNHKILIIIL